MNLTFQKWSAFCKRLSDDGMQSISVNETLHTEKQPFIVLKHDVETNVKKAFRMAQIEREFGHRGSYYVQAYLLNEPDNIALLRKMQQMGHEISYHFDVMDSNHGDLQTAMKEFEQNLQRFRDCGFAVKTLCQHGNPVVERVGYTSNRDFFRSEQVQTQYPDLCDIMVNYPQMLGSDYLYYSDAGRQFHLIFDPINNDRIDSSDKDIAYDDLDAVLAACRNKNAVISVHPHRYASSNAAYAFKTFVFRIIRGCAKLLMKVPLMKRLMGKYYYLAKKI